MWCCIMADAGEIAYTMTRADYFSMFMGTDRPGQFRLPDDNNYADFVPLDKLLSWHRKWQRGTWLGTQAAPKWDKDAFDCTRRAQHFLAFIHAQNAAEGNKFVMPIHFAKCKGHAFLRYVAEDKCWSYFDVETGMISRGRDDYEYAEMV